MDIGQMQFNLFGEIIEENMQKETKNVISDSYISGSKAMDLLDLSLHSFEKIIDSGAITPQIIAGKKCYDVAQIKVFMETETYKELVQGVVKDIKNVLDQSIQTLSLGALLVLTWNDAKVDFLDNDFYADFDNLSIRSALEKYLHRKINITEGCLGILEPEK